MSIDSSSPYATVTGTQPRVRGDPAVFAMIAGQGGFDFVVGPETFVMILFV